MEIDACPEAELTSPFDSLPTSDWSGVSVAWDEAMVFIHFALPYAMKRYNVSTLGRKKLPLDLCPSSRSSIAQASNLASQRRSSLCESSC